MNGRRHGYEVREDVRKEPFRSRERSVGSTICTNNGNTRITQAHGVRWEVNYRDLVHQAKIFQRNRKIPTSHQVPGSSNFLHASGVRRSSTGFEPLEKNPAYIIFGRSAYAAKYGRWDETSQGVWSLPIGVTQQYAPRAEKTKTWTYLALAFVGGARSTNLAKNED